MTGTSMKIALFGYGKMGKLIEKLATSRHHDVVAIIDSDRPASNSIANADVCIDFSHPSCALQNIQTAATHKKNIVMGTTGWHDHLEEAKEIVANSKIGCLYSPNFSLGIALFTTLAEEAAALISATGSYEIAGIELHHKNKVDAPSGTAKAIAERVNAQLPHPSKHVQFTSIRTGHFAGTHSLIFDSTVDTITFTHEAKNREGFALGALQAAEWLQGKRGFFTMQDFIRTLLCKN